MRNQIETIIKASRQAQTDQDWEKIDQQITTLSGVDPTQAAQIVLEFVGDEDSRVRDTSASILASLAIADPIVLGRSVNVMAGMATSDMDVFASGRAATFLLRHQDNNQYCRTIRDALFVFKNRAIINNWTPDLIANIPNDQLHQLLITNQS